MYINTHQEDVFVAIDVYKRQAVNDLQYWYRIKAATKVPDKDELNLFYETVDPTTCLLYTS